MIYETFREAVKNIWSNKFRTVLTMLGIIIGVTAVIVIVGLGNGMTQSIKDSFSEMGTNVLSVQITGRGSRTVTVQQLYDIVDSHPEVFTGNVAGAHGSLTASPRTAHAVAHEAPGCVAVQLACPVVILILGADAADVCFSCKFHRILLLKLCRSSRRGGAGRTRR